MPETTVTENQLEPTSFTGPINQQQPDALGKSQRDLKKLIVGFLLDKKILIDEESLPLLDKLTRDSPSFSMNPLLLQKMYESEINQNPAAPITGSVFLRLIQSSQNSRPKQQGTVEFLFHYIKPSKKREVKSFVSYFNKRYQSIKTILQNRQELENVTSISRLQTQRKQNNFLTGKYNKLGGEGENKVWDRDRPAQERVAIIGMIKEKRETANNNLIFVLEDPTGFINVLVTKNKPDLYNLAKQCVPDEVIAVVGMLGDNIIFANNILLPDVPLNKELKKAPDEVYAIFLSDIHVGSKQFLPEEFERFLLWLNGDVGSPKHHEIAKKVQYLFIVGDVVDGVGVYPSQQQELIIKDIYQQYEELARYLKRIPSRIQIILAPGNHDAVRLEEPQPPLHKEFARPLYGWPNLHLVSNPAMVNIHKSKDFPGFDVLVYHGYSFDHYIATVDHIRENGGYDRADLVMKFLLQRRHLSPSHSAAIYIPDDEEDPLVLSKVPDIFASGHLHKAAIAHYRNVTLLCSSCWQGLTPFQEKMGHKPEPARVPIINLQTRQCMMLNFEKHQEDEKEQAKEQAKEDPRERTGGVH